MVKNLDITIKNLTKVFRNENNYLNILNELNFNFQQGIGYSIQGISGTGKTTLINLICGLDIPTTGSIFYNEQDINQISENLKTKFLQSYVGIIFQESFLLNELTVLENVMIKGLILNQDNCKEIAIDLICSIGLQDKMSKYPHQLSGGEQQRISVARALFNKPKFLIADEPTAHLDKDNKHNIIDLLLRFKSDYNLGLIISTHDPIVAEAMNLKLEMKKGKLIER